MSVDRETRTARHLTGHPRDHDDRTCRPGDQVLDGTGIGLTIVVPAFNESSRFDTGVERLRTAVDRGTVDPAATEIVVVDDGSTDGTAGRAIELLQPFPHVEVVSLRTNAGKGAAIRAGVARARGPHLAFMDADMAVDPWQIPSLVEALAVCDLAIGSRSMAGSSADGDRLGRTMMGRAFNHIVNATTHVSLGDTQCGFKAFRTPVARLLFHCTVIDRFAFDVDVLWTARRLGLRIAQVPVHWRHVSGSRIRPLRDPFSMVSELTRSRIGLTAPSSIDALAVSDASALQEGRARRVVGPTLPIISWRRKGALVLFPLCEPERVDRDVARLQQAFAGTPVRRLSLTVTQLFDLAPLRLAGSGEVGSAAGKALGGGA